MARPMQLRAHREAMSVSDTERLDGEIAMAKQMAEILQRFYPGYQWATFADSRQGITWVAIPDIMGPSLRSVIHVDKLSDYSEMCKQLREAGGQILERFKLKRGECQLHAFSDALEKRITDHKTPMPE